MMEKEVFVHDLFSLRLNSYCLLFSSFDNVSVRFSHMDSPSTQLIIPNSINSKWMPGAEVLITSQSLSYNDQVTRRIVDVEGYDDDNVLIQIDSPIPRPLTTDGDNFRVEVALLSRNIVINGGHLTVYRTPDLKQLISGVQFTNLQDIDSIRAVSTSCHYLGIMCDPNED